MIKINMGCGWRNFGKDWVHIDSGDYDHLDYKSITDLKQFEDNTVDLIYASHVIEYFDREQVKVLFKEWHRVLRPGGTIRIAVPDFKTLSTLYLKNRISLEQVLGPLYGKMTMAQNVIYHRTAYDFLSLKKILQESKFSEVEKYDWRETSHSFYDDHSQAYIPHMDKEKGVLISLNVEAIKSV